MSTPQCALSSAEENFIKKQLFRTQRCKFFQKGRCSRGSSCSFAHESIAIAPDFTKTSLCKRFDSMAGCPLSEEECPFAHGVKDLRITPLFSLRRLEQSGMRLRQIVAPDGFSDPVPYTPGAFNADAATSDYAHPPTKKGIKSKASVRPRLQRSDYVYSWPTVDQVEGAEEDDIPWPKAEVQPVRTSEDPSVVWKLAQHVEMMEHAPVSCSLPLPRKLLAAGSITSAEEWLAAGSITSAESQVNDPDWQAALVENDDVWSL